MPQFAVYRSPGRTQDIVFVVQVQSSRLDQRLGRVVLPLVRCGRGAPPDHALTPHIRVQGQTVYANPLELATVPVARLGKLLEILQEADQDRVVQAIDEMISRA